MYINNKLTIGITALVLFIVAGYLIASINFAEGAAPSGIQTSVATSSTISVGPDEVKQLFGASRCDARVITTKSQPINISFGVKSSSSTTGIYGIASTTLSQSTGHTQTSTTTTAYDASVYGCGEVWAYGFNSTTTVSLTELR